MILFKSFIFCSCILLLLSIDIHFIIYMQNIPNAFVAAAGLLEKPKAATLRNKNGELFDVNLSHQTRNRIHMIGGWKSFVASNRLKASDVCHFKLKTGSVGNSLFDVRIKKKNPRS